MVRAVVYRFRQSDPLRRPWLSLPGDRRGTTALEFALVGPAFVLLLLLVVETAWQLTIDMALNIGVIAGSRSAITGADYNTVLSTIVSTSGGILKQANLALTTNAYASPASFASGGSAAASTGTGSSGQLVTYTATYTQAFLTPLPAAILGCGAITHTAMMIVQNERF
jgi:Flp pilus assembly protein TadG